jgi:seryl-tRNA synthetase
MLAQLQQKKLELQAAEVELAKLTSERDLLLAKVPNPPDDNVPDGVSDEDALVVKEVGEKTTFSFTPKDHLELGNFDMERGAKLSGARFTYRCGKSALLELALYRYAIDTLVSKGFTLVLPPVMVREEAMYGTGFLPTEESNLYKVEPDGLFLTGTSEVALAGLHQGEILDPESLPLKYAGYSTCFRREAGAAGKDTRGIVRLHQFDKVEMFIYCHPEESDAIHSYILGIEEEIVRGLGIPYRVVLTAAGDLGPSAAKKYDIEAWVPSQGKYREITSCSNTTSYQARRLQIRSRYESGTNYLHTLNGTAMTARFMVALLENFQDEKGRVGVPPVLLPFGAPEYV